MNFLFIILIIGLIVGFLTWAWIEGIDDMLENHPDYKGEDFLEDYPPHTQEDKWDDNKQHTKQNI